MFLGHVIYGLAIAVFLICFIRRDFIGWSSLIILVSGCIPDLDGIFDIMQDKLFFQPGQLLPHMVEHTRVLHSLGGLVIYSVLTGILLTYAFRLKFPLVALLAGIGFGAHIVEDMLVYNPSSAVFWPLSSVTVGIGIFSDYSRNFLGIGNTEVLLTGVVLLAGAVLVNLAMRKITGELMSESPERMFEILLDCLVGACMDPLKVIHEIMDNIRNEKKNEKIH